MKEKTPLLSQEQCRVRRGEVVIHTNRYWSDKLIAVDGADVLVVYDITDASQVAIYDLSGAFYCHAYPSDGCFPVTVLDLAREKRRAAQEARAKNHKSQPTMDVRHFSQVRSLEGIDVSCPHCQGVVRINIQASIALPLESDAVDLSEIQDRPNVD